MHVSRQCSSGRIAGVKRTSDCYSTRCAGDASQGRYPLVVVLGIAISLRSTRYRAVRFPWPLSVRWASDVHVVLRQASNLALIWLWTSCSAGRDRDRDRGRDGGSASTGRPCAGSLLDLALEPGKGSDFANAVVIVIAAALGREENVPDFS